MPRMSKKRKLELSFFLNDRGRVAYNDLCRKCQHKCKQSFRAVSYTHLDVYKRQPYDQPLSAGNYSICHLHEENNTLHEYLIINSFKEVTDFMKEISYEEQ